MKKTMLAGLVAVSVVAAAPRAVRAEEPGNREKIHTEWKERLGLSDEQTKKMDELRASEKAEMKPLREKGKTLMDKLKGQVDGQASDADLTATLKELADVHKSMRQVEETYKDRRTDILTPKQQAQSMLARMEHRDRGPRSEKGKRGPKKDAE